MLVEWGRGERDGEVGKGQKVERREDESGGHPVTGGGRGKVMKEVIGRVEI